MVGTRPASSQIRSLMRDASTYMAATYVAQALLLCVNFATKGILGPHELGIWSILLATLSMLGLVELGVVQAANREIAYAIGKGDEVVVQRIKAVQFAFTVLTAALASIGAILVAFVKLRAGGNDGSLWYGMVAIALMLPLCQIHLAQVSTFWANKRFSSTGALVVIEAGMASTLGIALVWAYGLPGQIAAFSAIVLAKVAMLWRWAARERRMSVVFAWDGAILWRLLRSGLPLQLINITNLAKVSGSVLVISHFFDTRSVGYYALALSVQSFVFWAPTAFSIVMFPRLQERYAASQDSVEALQSYLNKPLVVLGFVVLPALLSGAYFVAPVLIDKLLPSYLPVVTLLPAMLAGTYFLSLEHMPGQLLITTRKLALRVGLAMLSLAIQVACLAAAIALDAGLRGFVISLSLANALSFLALNEAAQRSASPGPGRHRAALGLLASFFYLSAVIEVIERVLPATRAGGLDDSFWAGVRWGCALLCLAPAFLAAERKLALIPLARALLASRKSANT
jgi:O-antigen/teichoic acid export membrane protein